MSNFGEFEKIKVGDRASLSKEITEEDIQKFVDMTGDDNPLHVDSEFASTTPFKDVVVHGMLGASFISTVIGTKLPGAGALWVSQTMNFLLPVRLGDEISVSCTVTKKQISQRLLELDAIIINQSGQVVLEGKGVVRVLQQKKDEEGKLSPHSKVAIITGGSGGIGSAICRKLAAEGFNVVINYNKNKRAAEKLARELNEKNRACAVAVQAEVSTDDGVKKLFEETKKAFGQATVLVNNASPRINPKPFQEIEWLDMQRHIDVQVKAAFLLSQALLPEMSESGYGRIVNITSQVVEGAPSLNWTAYALGKSALTSMSRYMALEYGPKNITVNCVAPGMTETSLIGDVPEKAQLMAARQTPVRSLASPEDVANSVAFLVSENSSHITGHTLHVNGGSLMA